MLGCEHYSPLLERHLDGELSPAERVSIEGHLASCTRCQRELRELRTLQSLVREAVEAGASGAELHAVWEGVAEWLKPLTVAERVWWGVKSLFFPFRPLYALAWGAALVIILLFTLPSVIFPPSPSVVVESVESETPVMIFQGEEGVTIIWLFETEEGKEG